MDPIEALERIVYLLDRAREPRYRARAFLKAADAIRDLSDEELRAMAEAGTLTSLANVGDVTASVITEVLAGDKPGYLRKLESKVEELGSAAGDAIRAQLKGDCHVHSTWSDGGAPIEAMARAAMTLGHDYIVMTDHSPRLTIANGLDRGRLLAQLEEIEALNAELAPFRILTGIEVDILEDGRLDQDDDMLARLDLVVASVHSKLRMAHDEMTRRMIVAIANPQMDILGHCTGRIVVGRGRPESTFDADLVFAACARFDKAVEINSRPERLDPPRRLLSRAIELGCKVAIDTDAHAPGQLEWQPYGCDRAAQCDVPLERIVNRLGADDLLAWAASHAGL
jgi:putative hydrolase